MLVLEPELSGLEQGCQTHSGPWAGSGLQRTLLGRIHGAAFGTAGWVWDWAAACATDYMQLHSGSAQLEGTRWCRALAGQWQRPRVMQLHRAAFEQWI